MMEILNKVIHFIASNYEWLFSGLGILVLGLFFKSRYSSVNKVTQKNIKARGDVIGRDKN